MCDIIGRAINQAFARRQLLAGVTKSAAALAASAAILGIPPSAAQAADAKQQVMASRASASAFRTRLILLGTAGGPVFWPNTDRCSTASAVVVGDAVYMVDCGHGSGKRLQEALYPAGMGHQTLKNVQALFFTHLHSDHIVDYPALLLYGHAAEGLNARAKNPFKVFGPGRRGQLEPVFSLPGREPANPPLVSPENPTPGTRDMTESIYQAFATDINDRIRDGQVPDIRSLVEVHDIALPEIAGFRSPNETPEPEMEPFTVFEDDRVKVSATLVNHFPIWPAFAFRLDTDDGSIVFSGDTAPSKNLVRMAKNADVLVHEVIVTSWVDKLFPGTRNQAEEATRHHLLSAHTAVEDVGKVAEEAGVATLVLNHVVPGNASMEDLAGAQNGFSGKVIVGNDLLELGVRRGMRP